MDGESHGGDWGDLWELGIYWETHPGLGVRVRCVGLTFDVTGHFHRTLDLTLNV